LYLIQFIITAGQFFVYGFREKCNLTLFFFLQEITEKEEEEEERIEY
jgi:hypothetical protein